MSAPANHQVQEISVKKHLFVRRPLAVLAALAVGSTVMLGLAPSAQAADLLGQFIVATDFDESGAPGCSLTSDTSDSFESTFAADGAAKAGSFASTGTVEDAGDAADDTSLFANATGRVRATQAGGSLKTLSLATTLSARVQAAQGTASECDSTASAMSGAQAYFSLADAGWLTVRASVRGGGLELQIISLEMGQGAVQASANLKADSTRRFFLNAGTYVLLGVFETSVVTPSAAGDPTAVVGGGSLDASFTAAGNAVGAAAGNGRAYVTFDPALACGARSLAGRFTKKAGQVKTATFFVNGKRNKVVRGPGAGGDVVLRGLPAAQDVTVRAVLKLKAGGSRTVSRSYATCS